MSSGSGVTWLHNTSACEGSFCNSTSDFDFSGKNGVESMESFVFYSCTHVCIHFHRAWSLRVTGLQHSFPILEVTDIFLSSWLSFFKYHCFKTWLIQYKICLHFTIFTRNQNVFSLLKKEQWNVIQYLPKELVLFPLSFELFCAECEYLLSLWWILYFTEFQSLTDYFHFVPKFLHKKDKNLFMPFHVLLIQQLEIWRIYQFSKYIRARMNCSILLLKN